MHLKRAALTNHLRTTPTTHRPEHIPHRRRINAIRTGHKHIIMQRQQPDTRDVELRGEEHDGAHGALDRDARVAVDRADCLGGADRREGDVRAVVPLDGLDVVQPVCEHPVQLPGEDRGVAGDDCLALLFIYI